MFQRKIKELCQTIHDTIGKNKINDCFLVDVEFSRESFVVKAVNCLSNHITHDYSAKSWSRFCHFKEFIKPTKNTSISLKDHKCNCLHRLFQERRAIARTRVHTRTKTFKSVINCTCKSTF